jgi:hypothetical protein
MVEVWLGQPYNSSCDVYSFSIVLWEIIALNRAFHFCDWANETHFASQVFKRDARPDLDRRWPGALQELFQRSWCAKHQDRLTMADVTKALRGELVSLRHGDDSRIADHKRRRSSSVFFDKALLQDSNKSADFLGSHRSLRSGMSVGSWGSVGTSMKRLDNQSTERGRCNFNSSGKGGGLLTTPTPFNCKF